MRKQIQALGRLKTGQMNKTESAYCQHLEQRKRAPVVMKASVVRPKCSMANKRGNDNGC